MLKASCPWGRAGRAVVQAYVEPHSPERGRPLRTLAAFTTVTAKQHDEDSWPEPLPLGQSLQARFLSQVRRLPAATQVLLLADPALLWRAGPHLGFGINAASPAEVAEMVTIGRLQSTPAP
jgi:hypothetical protein